MKGIFYYSKLWAYELTKEIISRVVSIVMFPIAYILRNKIRTHMYSIDEALVKERTFLDTHNVPLGDFYNKVNKVYFFLWFFLDDSPAKDNTNIDGSLMYDYSSNDNYFPKWVLNTNYKWLRATWWSFIRNNTVNYVSWFRTTGWVSPMVYETLWGEYKDEIDKSDDNSYYVKGMYLINVLHKDGKYYPRFTYVGEIFGRKIGIWQGNSKGSGRFSFSVRA